MLFRDSLLPSHRLVELSIPPEQIVDPTTVQPNTSCTSSPYKLLRNKFEFLTSSIELEKVLEFPVELDKSPFTGHHIPDNLNGSSDSNSQYDSFKSDSSQSDEQESLFSSVRLQLDLLIEFVHGRV